MESTELEKLQLGVIRELCVLSRESLRELCEYFITGAELEQVSEKGRTALITLITSYIQRGELAGLEDQGMADLLHLQDKIHELQAASNASVERQAKEQQTKQDEEEKKLLKEIEALQLQLALTKEERDNEKRTDTNNNGHTEQVTQNTAHHFAPSFWHKEFKLLGQIGEPGQKDRLTFSSLARQIEHGLLKGFSETEIVDAVVRAIVPGMQLRSYLEGKGDLKLPTLRRILRCHFQEKSATELYKQLSSEVQGIKETPQNFLIRALDLRQKILFASQESESGLRYDPVLVQNMFLHSVLTGLQNDNVKRDLQPYLEQANVSDEVLFEKLNTACTHESERQDKRKMTTPQRSVAVHSAQSDHTPAEKKEKTNQPGHGKNQADILSELQEMKANMSLLKDLKAEVASIKESMQQPSYPPRQPPDPVPPPVHYGQPQRHWSAPAPAARHGYLPSNQRYVSQRYLPTPAPRRRRRCYACEQENVEDCIHCFRCGSNEHFAAGCRMSRSGQFRGDTLNGQGPPPRGRE